jgi:hypothetical protein
VRRKARLLSSHGGIILSNTTVLFAQWITLTSSVTDLLITSQCKDILQLLYQLSDQDVLRNSGAFFFKDDRYKDGSAARNQKRQLFY